MLSGSDWRGVSDDRVSGKSVLDDGRGGERLEGTGKG